MLGAAEKYFDSDSIHVTQINMSFNSAVKTHGGAQS